MSAKSHIQEIDRALQGQYLDRDDYVLQSWRRCVNDHGLDPLRANPAYVVPERELRRHQEQSEKLISIARSGLQDLFQQVAGQNYVVLLADTEGVTVDFFGDPSFEDRLRSSGLHMGINWAEHVAGTCGVGACLATGKAVTVHQQDHFDIKHTQLSCSAAPIFDITGALTAVLDLSLLRPPQPKISQMLALQLVKASARRIEMANLMAQMRGEWILRFSQLPEFLDVDPEAAVAVDGSGRIIAVTRSAVQILRAARPGPVQHAVIGNRLEDFFALSVNDLPTLTPARPSEERVIHLCNGAAFFGHAIAPQRPPAGRAGDAAPGLPGPLRTLSGDDPAMHRIQLQAAKLARGPISILIKGQSGTGKNRVAQAIHEVRAAQAPFVTVSCAEISGGAFDAMLFGGRAGQRGLIDAAHGGTLFLDEVGEMPLATQARLARVLSDGQVLATGQRSKVIVPTKIISTTSHDLSAMVAQGEFRADLLFRIAAAQLHLPRLRARTDMDWLIDRLLRQRTITQPSTYQLTPAARMELHRRDWPGNIRELINTLDVAVALARGAVIDLEDLPDPVLHAGAMRLNLAHPVDPGDLRGLLVTCGWNIARAARRLGVDRSTVHRRMQRQGIRRPN